VQSLSSSPVHHERCREQPKSTTLNGACFRQTIDRPDLARKLIRVAHPRNLPVVLSRDEVARLLNATTCLKHQAALSVAYAAGLRVAEVAALKIADIDSERMLIRVERGKGGRYRNAMLPADLLTVLREWWKAGRQQGVMHRDGWLFPGQHAMKPISKRIGPHTLRHYLPFLTMSGTFLDDRCCLAELAGP
jgi:integrase/recombinase XerD